jgi:hypothetical protein
MQVFKYEEDASILCLLYITMKALFVLPVINKIVFDNPFTLLCSMQIKIARRRGWTASCYALLRD